MRYRCVECGKRCTVSVFRDVIPTVCIADPERKCNWQDEAATPVKDGRSYRLNIYMREDARGYMIECIDPANAWNPSIFRSINEASKVTGINKGSIARAVKSEGKLKGGDYYWKRHFLTPGDEAIRKAAQAKDVEAYKAALRKHDVGRYVALFGGDE